MGVKALRSTGLKWLLACFLLAFSTAKHNAHGEIDPQIEPVTQSANSQIEDYATSKFSNEMRRVGLSRGLAHINGHNFHRTKRENIMRREGWGCILASSGHFKW